MYDKRPSKSFLIFFLIVGLYLFIVSRFPTSLEITHTESGVQAYMQTRSMLPPFNNIQVFIPKLERAIITTDYASEGGPDYRVELEDVEGRCFPISPFFSSDYKEAKLLEKRINDSIENKYKFSSKNLIEHDSLQQFGFLFMLISAVALIIPRQKENNTNQQKRPKHKGTSKNGRKTQVLPISHQTQQPKADKEKYKNINDSIIK